MARLIGMKIRQTCLFFDEFQVNSIIDYDSKPACVTPSSFSNSPLSQYSVNVIPQDQIDDELTVNCTNTPCA